MRVPLRALFPCEPGTFLHSIVHLNAKPTFFQLSETKLMCCGFALFKIKEQLNKKNPQNSTVSISHIPFYMSLVYRRFTLIEHLT